MNKESVMKRTSSRDSLKTFLLGSDVTRSFFESNCCQKSLWPESNWLPSLCRRAHCHYVSKASVLCLILNCRIIFALFSMK